jgi:hypothetical protein
MVAAVRADVTHRAAAAAADVLGIDRRCAKRQCSDAGAKRQNKLASRRKLQHDST